MAVSPVELVYQTLKATFAEEDLPGGVFVGPAPETALEAGCLVLSDLGIPQPERYAPVVRARVQVRCEASSVDQAERIAGAVQAEVKPAQRRVVDQANGERYLVHAMTVVAGPTLTLGDAEESWAKVLQIEVLASTEEVE